MDKFYWYWLANIPGIGNQSIDQLLAYFGSPKEIYNSSEINLRQSNILTAKQRENFRMSKENSHIYNEYLDMKKKNITMICSDDAEYPKRLRNIYNRPVCLYIKGVMPSETYPSVAIVGARNCSEYGRSVAYMLGKQLAQSGVTVISGMASGIDGAAHRGALATNGCSVGVLAGGVDHCYPRENFDIYEHIQKNGCLISEYAPGIKPTSNHFPLRNRIISGLADVIVVVEAREKSGSLITVDMALEQNKMVLAVPGRINDELSKGCNNLIKLGAGVVTATKDVLECLDFEVPLSVVEMKKNTKLLAREEEMVYSCLDLLPQNLDNILEETGLDFSIISECLLSLEFKDMIKEVTKGYYVKTGIEV